MASSRVLPPMERPTSAPPPPPPPPLEASDLSLFEELLLKDPDEVVISALGAIYEREAFKGGCKGF